MYAKSVKVTLKPAHGFTALTLAKAIHDLTSYPSQESLAIARSLLEGHAWEPPPSDLKEATFHSNWLDFQITMPSNPYLDQVAKWEMQHAILLKGAAGDAEAAIRYCQMELNHEIDHGAMG